MPQSHILQAAAAHFASTDPVMAALLAHATKSEPPLSIPVPQPPSTYFAHIVTSIISQQISTKAADAVRGRVIALLGTITPAAILATEPDALRACGLSPQKLSYITKSATSWHTLGMDDVNKCADEAVIAELTKLHGVGRWTAEMFCIFTLARPDVFSFGDLGLMQSLYHYYDLKPHYNRKIKATVERWAPYRSMAALVLWRARDTGLQW